MKLRRRTLTLLATGVVAALCAGVASAAFTDVKTNPQMLKAAATWPVLLHMTSGSYVGNGITPRVISATSFKPDLVIIRGDTGQVAVARTSTMAGDVSKPLIGGAAFDNDNIVSLNANGFTVGKNNRVNASGIVYYWTAMQVGPGTMSVGTYAGNGAASRPITGLGFSPDYVAVMDAGGSRAVQRYAGMTRSYQFDGDTGQAATRIVSLDGDGFTVGNSAEVNRAGNTYHYFAFNIIPTSISIGSYTGDGADNRNIGGIGFLPGFLMIRAENTATARAGAFRFTGQPGDNSFMQSNTVAASNIVQSFLADGFQIGTDLTVNQATIKYFYVALNNSASACQQTGTYTVTGPADTFVESSNPTRNNGTNNALKVKSKVGDNRRTLVRHTLPPELDPDCEIKSAKLVLTDTNAKGGRTYQALLAAAPWAEKVVTWNNQPATTGAPVTATTPATNGQTVEFDVTASIRGMYGGTVTNNGFVIRDAAEDDAGGVENVFASNENGSADPQIILVIGAP